MMTISVPLLVAMVGVPISSSPRAAGAAHGTMVPVARRICKTITTKKHSQKTRTRSCHVVKPPVLRIISMHLPAYASRNLYANSSAHHANDGKYNTEYRSIGLPAWVAYDLSSIPAKHRSRVLAVYYNVSYGYDTEHGAHYDNLADYTIDGNAAPKGSAPPRDGWVTLVSVIGNSLHSRQHVLKLARYNWVRLRVTRSDGAPENRDAAFTEFDLYDLGSLPHAFDDWIFFGDSITARAMVTVHQHGVASFAMLIHQSNPSRRPVAENAGEPFDTSETAVHRLLGRFSIQHATGYLSIFPGTYVVLAYGTDEAAVRSDGGSYFRNIRRLVQAVLALGKVPVIPKIGFTKDARRNANIRPLNARINQLYAAYPKIVKGPDFWDFFRQHPNLIQPNDNNPTGAGLAAMRLLWATTMLREVYDVRRSGRPGR